MSGEVKAYQKRKEPILRMREIRMTVNAIRKWKRINFSDVPTVFGNSMPKSGSHLLLQILHGLAEIAPFRFVKQNPIRVITGEGRIRSHDEILQDLNELKPGVIGWGYLTAEADFQSFFNQHPDLVSYFVYRDPRDQLISSILYAVDIHQGHAMHEYYANLPLDEAIKAAIIGDDRTDQLHLPNPHERYAKYFGWLDTPNTLCLRFEDLINDQENSLNAILDHLERRHFKIPTPRPEALRVVREAIQPTKSPTFRKGKSGGWREHFTQEHIDLFKEVNGDLLIRLGYETDNDW
jgi:hypothetical protein